MKFSVRLLRKIVVAALFAPVLIVGLAACGDKDERTPTPQTRILLRCGNYCCAALPRRAQEKHYWPSKRPIARIPLLATRAYWIDRRVE